MGYGSLGTDYGLARSNLFHGLRRRYDGHDGALITASMAAWVTHDLCNVPMRDGQSATGLLQRRWAGDFRFRSGVHGRDAAGIWSRNALERTLLPGPVATSGSACAMGRV